MILIGYEVSIYFQQQLAGMGIPYFLTIDAILMFEYGKW